MIPEFNFGPRIGGLYPSQAKCFEASATITLLDLRVPWEGDETRGARRTPQSEAIPADAAVAVKVPLGGLAERFLTKAFGKLSDVLKTRFKVTLGMWIDEGVQYARMVDEATGQDITEAEAQRMIAELEPLASPEKEEEYKWGELVENVVAECVKLLKGLRTAADGEPEPEDGEWEGGVRRNFNKEKLDGVAAQAIVPSGKPQMEMTFGAGGEQIQYPNPWAFDDEHWKRWAEFSPYAATRGKLDFVYGAALWLPHEVLHCVQDAALGVAGAGAGTAAENWQCKYCVSFGQTLFLATLIGEHRKRGAQRNLMLPSHIIEEALLWYEACLTTQPEAAASAARWRGSQGAAAPSATQPQEYSEDNLAGYLGLLGGVVLESWKAQQNHVERDEQVTSYFAEFVKYTNRLLCGTSAAKLPEVAASLVAAP